MLRKHSLTFFLLLGLGLSLAGCNLPGNPSQPTPVPAVPATEVPATASPSPAPVATETFTPQPPTATATETPIPPTETATPEPTVTPVPTYAILRGTVNVEKVSCRYGPGSMYLYLYGMVQGANQDIIGRTDTGKWVLTRAHGDKTVCWVKTDLLDLNGDVLSVEMVYPDKYKLPVSPYYRPLTGVNAQRKGGEVVISWTAQALRAGDEESATSVLYVVEAWVCQGGQLVFTPIGAYTNIVNVPDEGGCAQPSHGRVYFSEKHGYAGPSEIPWPAP